MKGRRRKVSQCLHGNWSTNELLLWHSTAWNGLDTRCLNSYKHRSVWDEEKLFFENQFHNRIMICNFRIVTQHEPTKPWRSVDFVGYVCKSKRDMMTSSTRRKFQVKSGVRYWYFIIDHQTKRKFAFILWRWRCWLLSSCGHLIGDKYRREVNLYYRYY